MTAIAHHDRPDVSRTVGLEVSVTPSPPPGTAHVRVSGEVDFGNAAILREDLLTALASQRDTPLVDLSVDLSRVTFCDCAGLNALLCTRLAALRVGRGVRITAASRPVERLLHLTATGFLLASRCPPQSK
ncbi:STAS domain-containing protein [Streptomyces lavendulae]|uniref:STAS domain-containing protein n=1 Tax=Streptomyces lavendulae TaxID=1914 RepID=UPI00332E940D